MRYKTILYIAPALPVGGAEKFLVSLTGALGNETEKQVLVSLSDINPLQTEFDKKINFHCFARKYKFDIKPVMLLRKLIREEKPSLVLCLNFFTYFILRCAVAGWSSKPKTVISYHSTTHPTKKEDLLHRIYAMILRKSDLIITVSANQASFTAKRYRLPERAFKTIYNGIDTTKWRLPSDNSERTRLRNEYGLPADAKVIIITAAFRIEKNHVAAVKALDILHRQHHCKPYLLLVGQGVTMNGIRELVKQLELDDFVKFSGVQQKVLPFYWASDVFTLCSNSVETFSIAALEAMACGLPCVLTDIGGANEMVVNGLNGYLCKPDENDIAITWHKVLTGTFSPQTIHEYVDSRFGIDKMCTEYTAAFDHFLNNK